MVESLPYKVEYVDHAIRQRRNGTRSGRIRDSLIRVDDRQRGDDEILMLYSLYAREDRQTRQIALHTTRLFAFKDGWVGDAILYRISM